jgi:hypothetical protein
VPPHRQAGWRLPPQRHTANCSACRQQRLMQQGADGWVGWE